MDNSHADSYIRLQASPPWPPAPPAAHSCKFCWSLQAQCLPEADYGDLQHGKLKFNVTARDIMHHIEHEYYCDFIALMAAIWKTAAPSRSPSSGDMSKDIMFPMSGSDRIPDEVRSHSDDFILFLAANTLSEKVSWVPHDVVEINGFGFLHASNLDCFQWSFGYVKPLFVYATFDDPASKCITSRPMNTRPGGEETHALAKSWLSSCIGGEEDHADWCKPPLNDFVPTRLLEIHGHPTSYSFLTKLVQLTRPVSYAALSYCWGGEQPHKTTGARFEAYRTGIPWHALPQSIQDAVKITYELGLRYLWVDAFCIIQDDAVDTAQEIAQMPHIYTESTVTIVASRASKSSAGFLHDVQPRELVRSTFRLSLKCSDGTLGSIYVMDAEDNAFETTLETRGWALQEWCLSPRIIDYDATQVSWHCAASVRQTDFSNGWRQYPKFKGSTIYEEFRQKIEEVSRATGSNDRDNSSGPFAMRVWKSLVETYTKRDLTDPADRILAISGLAQRCAVIHPDRYLAGLWQRSIVDSLLWTRGDSFFDKKPINRTRPEIFQGPSWSWTSINGPVHLRDSAGSPQVEFLDADIGLVNSHAVYGAVNFGVLKLRGPLRPAIWGGDNRLYHWKGPLLRFDAVPDCVETDVPWHPAVNEAGEKNVAFDIYLLLVRSNERLDKKQNVTVLEHAGLILRRSLAHQHRADARFSRLGHFSSMSSEYALPRPDWDGPEEKGMETHAFFDRCLEQVIELE